LGGRLPVALDLADIFLSFVIAAGGTFHGNGKGWKSHRRALAIRRGRARAASDTLPAILAGGNTHRGNKNGRPKG
jgi:hypothetical protein